MNRNIIRNVILYIAYSKSDKNQNIPIILLYNNDRSDYVPLEDFIKDFNLDELDVVDFLVELESIFNVSIFLEDFYKFKTIGDLVSKIEDAYNKERKCI